MDEMIRQYEEQYYELCGKLDSLMTYYVYLKDEDYKRLLMRQMLVLDNIRLRLYNQIKEKELYTYNWLNTFHEDLKQYVR